MRPLQLKLKGINSYREEQIIDFETLTSQGLFGIFGPTGSGKSSILDAMTLALYAKLPRDTKSFINTNEKTASVSFLFSITTDKTRKYLAERSFRYHTNSNSSTVRNTTGRLIAYDGETETVLADKPTDVTTECIHLLGLTSEDFMRTVVLPQGQFSEFLRLKNKERRIMLQRIFHLEKYGIELTSKIARARQKQDLLLSKLDGEKKAYEEVSSEQLSKCKKEQKEQKKLFSSLSDQLAVLEKSFQKTNELYTLQQELLPLKEEKEKKEQELPSIEEMKRSLDTAQRANQLRPFSNQSSRAKESYEQALSSFETIQKETDLLTVHFKKAKNEYERALTSQENELPVLQSKEQLLKTAQSLAATIQDWANSQNKFQKNLESVSATLAPLKEQQQEHLKKEQLLRSEIQTAEKRLEAGKITQEQKLLLTNGNIMEENYREKHENYMKNKEVLSSLKNEIQKEESAFSQQQESLQSVYTQLLCRLSYLEEQQLALTSELEHLNEKTEQNKQQQKLWQQDHMAQLLREELKEGCLCPVCGTPYEHHSHSPLPHSENKDSSTNRLHALEKEQKQLNKQSQKQQKHLNQLEKELYSLNSYISNLKNALEITEETSCSYESSASASDIVPDYFSISKQISEYLTAKGELRRQYEQYTRQDTSLRAEHDILQGVANKIFALRKENEIESFSEALKALTREEQEHQTQEEQIKEKRQTLEQLFSEKETLSHKISDLEKDLSSLLTNIENCKKVIAEQTKKFPETFSIDMDFASEITKIQKQQADITTHLKNTEITYQQKNEELQSKRKMLSSCESSRDSAYKHFKQTSQLYLTQKKELGFSESEQPERYYMDEKQLLQTQKTVDSYYDAVRQTDARIHFLQERSGNREVTASEWTSQKEEVTALQQQVKDLNDSLLLLKDQIQRLTKDLDKKKELEEQWTKEAHKKDIIKELEQLFKGNAFIEYVAQSKLSYIAREASVILSKISGGNYALEINESAEFIIRDNKNGGAVRPSDTLSGGELFITSLSLALALSSSIQLNGAAPLEFFFLDEGFGSLDDDLLDMVMDSLERLQSKKRSIGIISHVEAIQARVPVKLLVTPSDLSQKGSQIALEYS